MVVPHLLTTGHFEQGPLQEIERRLCRQISESLTHGTKVVSLRAPAGYGKTTLARQSQRLLEQQGVDCRYLSLTAQHNKRAAFVDLLQRNSCRLETCRQNFTRFRNLIIDQLDCRQDTLVIVLDGLEHILSREIQEFISRMIFSSSAAVTFMLLSRTELPLPLSELRMQGRLLEPTLQQLSLSDSEVGELGARILGYKLDSTLIDGIQKKTMGWSAGVTAALQALQQAQEPKSSLQQFSGRDRGLVSYFRENVFSRLGTELQQFLLTFCENPLISLAQIDKIRSDGVRMMEAIESQGVLTTEIARDRSYCHLLPLFQEFLNLEAQYRRTSETTVSDHDKPNRVIYADFDSHHRQQATQAESWPMVESLTNREQQLLQLISDGDTNREIAEKLFISEQTVKWHLNKVYAKLGVKNRTTAVAKARSCCAI
ncbi:LuxR family transcriptional regulator [Pseudomaricurvus alkylphenolicus]|uniref:LuxR family transcriptional regulator n=1 Tax=Pseudomaricurvus alkylphenolicus TaxID=1306991 RepID=UPI001980EDA1|nr:LuxR family transcriptional regulator [Pseudomaricurvus alkylphenolicus]